MPSDKLLEETEQDVVLPVPEKEHAINRVLSLRWPGWMMMSAVALMFVASTLFHGVMLSGPHQLTIYYDELLYWRMAQTFNTAPLTVYHVPVDFSKFLYSLLLSPLFRLEDPVLRTVLAGWINAALISSSVFPAYRIVRKITPSTRVQLAAMLLFTFSPMMNYSEKYIAECLFLPMGLYLILGCFRLFEKAAGQDCSESRLFMLSALLGLYAYLTYLAKESALAIAACFIVWSLISAARQSDQPRYAARRLFLALGHALGLLVPFALQTVLFRGAYSYSAQVGIENIGTWEKVLFFFKCLTQNGLYTVITGFGLPVLFWQLRYNRERKLSDEPEAFRDFVFFLFLSFIVIQLGTAYAINVKEDLGKEAGIRLHTRYVIPYLPVFLAMGLEEIRLTPHGTRRRNVAMVSVVGAASLLVLNKIRYASTFDSVDSWHIRNLADVTKTSSLTNLPVNDGILVVILLFTLWMLLVVFLSRRSRIAAFSVFCVVALGIQVYNNYDTLDRNSKNTMPNESQITGFAELDKAILEQVGEDENLLVISAEKLEGRKRRLETFLSRDFHMVNLNDLIALKGSDNEKLLEQTDGVLDLNETQLPVMLTTFTSVRYYPEGTTFRYVLCCSVSGDDGYVAFNPDSVEKVRTFSGTGYTLYRLTDPSRLEFEQLGKTTYK